MRSVLAPKSLALDENLINCQGKAPFVLILTKPVEPICQSAGPILGRAALEETLQISIIKYKVN